MRSLPRIWKALAEAGANLTVRGPGLGPVAVGPHPERTRVVFGARTDLGSLARRDLSAVIEAYLEGRVEVSGDFGEVVKLTEVIAPDPNWHERWALGARLLLRDRRRLQRESVAFHYDRPPAFFLPWLERWRSYSHGLYRTPEDAPEQAQERKLAAAVEALGLEPGMRVFDMGCGWGSFLEYAGERGIRVHGITLSAEQRSFCEGLIQRRNLPCTVDLVDFLDFSPPVPFDAAVFMGTFEHTPGYRRAWRFLARNLREGGRVWADFCCAREVQQVGDFLARHVWPGTAQYVSLPRLLDAAIREGFNVLELSDDTLSYGYTCRDWADALDREAKGLSERFGERDVRVLRVYLRASQHFFLANRTQAYHLVAGLGPRDLAG